MKPLPPAVVSIEAFDDAGKAAWTGSGFIVSADGKLLTNLHVIRNSKKATVKLESGDAYDSVEALDVDVRKENYFTVHQRNKKEASASKQRGSEKNENCNVQHPCRFGAPRCYDHKFQSMHDYGDVPANHLHGRRGTVLRSLNL